MVTKKKSNETSYTFYSVSSDTTSDGWWPVSKARQYVESQLEEPTPAKQDALAAEEPSRDELYDVLANRRRRYVIHYLQYHEGAVDLGILAEQVAAWQYDVDTEQLTSTQRKNVYTALQQRHLPKMDEAGVVSFDRRTGNVSSTDALSEIEIYTEVVPSGDFPWSRYYLGMSAVIISLLTAAWVDVYPFRMLADMQWGFLCATWVLISAVVHEIMTRKMKLGTDPEPPEVDR